MTLVRRESCAKDVAMFCMKNYEDNTSAYLQDVIKNALSSFYSSILNAEFLAHLGYAKSSSASKESGNRRNGFIHKKVRSSLGPLDIMVPRDRDGSFNPIAVRKHSRAVTSTESQLLAMYARGMCDEDIMLTVQKIYGYELPAEKVQIIKQRVLADIRDSAFRPLKSVYAFVLLAKIDLKVRSFDVGRVDDISIVLAHGVDQRGHKELLDMYLVPPGPRAACMFLLDNLKQRGVEDIVVLATSGIYTKETEVHQIYPITMVY